MYRRILFPTDGSEGSETAFEHALGLADVVDASVHVLYVADTTRESVTVVGGDVVDALEEEGRRIVEGFADRARTRGIDVEPAVLAGEPLSTILDYVDAHDVDLLVMPTHGRQGIERHLLGSVTEKVVRTSPVPVLTVRLDPDE